MYGRASEQPVDNLKKRAEIEQSRLKTADTARIVFCRQKQTPLNKKVKEEDIFSQQEKQQQQLSVPIHHCPAV